MTLTEFLLARIAEDEVRSSEWTYTQDLGIRTRIVTVHPGIVSARVLAECEAKRHLLDEALVWGEGCLDVMARYMAEVYADHPAYRAEWRP